MEAFAHAFAKEKAARRCRANPSRTDVLRKTLNADQFDVARSLLWQSMGSWVIRQTAFNFVAPLKLFIRPLVHHAPLSLIGREQLNELFPGPLLEDLPRDKS